MHDRDKSSSWNAGIAGGFTVDGGFEKGDTFFGQDAVGNRTTPQYHKFINKGWLY